MAKKSYVVRNVHDEVEEESVSISSECDEPPQRKLFQVGLCGRCGACQMCSSFISGVLSCGSAMFIIAAVKSTAEESKAMNGLAATFFGAFSLLCLTISFAFNKENLHSKLWGGDHYHSRRRASSYRVTYSKRDRSKSRRRSEERHVPSQKAITKVSQPQTPQEQSDEMVSEPQPENRSAASVASKEIAGPSTSMSTTVEFTSEYASRMKPEAVSADEQKLSQSAVAEALENKEQQNAAEASSGSEYEELSNGEVRRRKVITEQEDFPQSSSEDPEKQ